MSWRWAARRWARRSTPRPRRAPADSAARRARSAGRLLSTGRVARSVARGRRRRSPRVPRQRPPDGRSVRHPGPPGAPVPPEGVLALNNLRDNPGAATTRSASGAGAAPARARRAGAGTTARRAARAAARASVRGRADAPAPHPSQARIREPQAHDVRAAEPPRPPALHRRRQARPERDAHDEGFRRRGFGRPKDRVKDGVKLLAKLDRDDEDDASDEGVDPIGARSKARRIRRSTRTDHSELGRCVVQPPVARVRSVHRQGGRGGVAGDARAKAMVERNGGSVARCTTTSSA